MSKKIVIFALLSIGVLLIIPRRVTAQTPNTRELFREEFHRTFPMSPTGRISLENIQGTVRIQAWDRSEVKVDAVKSAYSRELLNEAEIKIDENQFAEAAKFLHRSDSLGLSPYSATASFTSFVIPTFTTR